MPRRERPRVGPLDWIAVGIAALFAASPLASGYFNFGAWGPISLGLLVILLVLIRIAPLSLTGPGRTAATGIGVLLILSAASILWAESKESAWTDTNRLALYCVVFAIVILAVRDRRTARIVALVLGSAALITSLVLCASMVLGDAQGAFIVRRLNAPMGYINGTAGMLVMGLWPWLAYAESAKRSAVRAGSLAAAALIANTAVLTQSRAVVPATAVAIVLALICASGRTRRALHLIVVAAAVGAALAWTLAVYTSGGAAMRTLPPGQGTLRAAAVAMLISALGAGIVGLGICRSARALSPERAARARNRLGAVLLAATLAGGLAAAIAGGPWIARQYRYFVSLHATQQSAAVRFVDASGFRYDLWRVAVREFRSHPIGGIGAGNYDVEYYRLRHSPEYVLQPHSLELQMAAELGVGGIVGLLLFCGGILWAGCARRGTLASGDRMVKVAATGVFAAWLTGTSVDWLYDIPGLTGLAMIAGALLVVPSREVRSTEAPRTNRTAPRRLPLVVRRVALGCSLAAIAVAAASVGRQYAATRFAGEGAGEVHPLPRRRSARCGGLIRSTPIRLPRSTRSRLRMRPRTITRARARRCCSLPHESHTTTSRRRCWATSRSDGGFRRWPPPSIERHWC